MPQAATQLPQAPYKPTTNLVLHYNGTGALNTGENDMSMSDPIGTDNRTNKDLPEQVLRCTAQQMSIDSTCVKSRRSLFVLV
jgi:hypothetical protein